MSVEYAIIVKNKTRLEFLTEQFNTKSQAQFYIERLGGNFRDYELEHDTFHESLHSLQTQLSKIVKHKVMERAYVPSYLFSDNNIIIAIGQDGLVANTAKYANNVPIIGVNPDKSRYDGILLPFDTSDFLNATEQVLSGQFSSKTVHFAEAVLNDGQRLLAFNDLFIGTGSHVSARYRISYNEESEEHSSSGIIVSTQAGSSGWLSSVFNMAYGVAGLFDKALIHKQPKVKPSQLVFAVREPFKSIKTQVALTAGVFSDKDVLTIESLMPTNGVIFSDGIESDFLKFTSGTIARIGLAKETARLVIKNTT